uniref:Spermidine synthase n=1 Tax=Ciona savignyi TaxID=51511 RepID=H2YMD8_CIOSA
ELNPLWAGQCMSLSVEEVLFHERSKYQDVLVFKSKTYGNVLVLDGVIQCTERDEFSYQEMAAHLPLFSHPNPQNVLVIGGGDGGVIREILKHPSVESVTQCEIDQVVIDVCRKFLPSMSKSMDDSRVTQYIGDGLAFMRDNRAKYDVIITDSSDPQGPAECLFEKPYYELMRSALKDGGIICAQGECMWLHLKLICKMKEFCESLFPSVSYGYCTIPTYPSGQIGFMLCGLSKVVTSHINILAIVYYTILKVIIVYKISTCHIRKLMSLDTNFKEPCRVLSESEYASMGLKYYNPEIHKAAFVLPQFAKLV